MDQVLAWVILIECLSWACWLIVWPLFERWPDRGVGLSRAAGPLLLAQPAWLLSWVGAPALARSWAWAFAAGALLVALAALRWRSSDVHLFLRNRRAEWLSAVAIWIVVFAVFLAIRTANPILSDGEKPMDFAMLNAGIRAIALPLYDPWLAGASLNYYYFGYLTWAMLAKMLGTPSAMAYDLAVSSIPAAVAAAAWSIGLALTSNRWLAGLTVVAVVFFGNLAAVPQVWQIGTGFDVWAPTRVIRGTINEFPFFTFYWADLHPHLLAMPSFMVAVGLALAVRETRSDAIRRWSGLALLGVSAGSAVATSLWEFAPLGVIVLALLFERWRGASVRAALLEGLTIMTLAAIVAAPLYRTISGAGVQFGMSDAHSPLVSFLVVQGLWLLPAALMIVTVLRTGLGIGASAAVLAITAVAALLSRNMTLAMLAAFTLVAWRSFLRLEDRQLWLLVATALTVLLAAELGFMDSAHAYGWGRMNMVFKFHLQACLLLGLAWPGCAHWLWRHWTNRTARAVLANALSVAVALAAIYPLGAIASGVRPAGNSSTAGERRDGPATGDRLLIEFMNREIAGQPVIAEATGESYTRAARISAGTGLPAIVGWNQHELQWRGDASKEEIVDRVRAVGRLYQGDMDDARAVVDTYRVRYVVVGELERQMYPAADFAKFDRLGKKMFDRDGTLLYDVASVRPE